METKSNKGMKGIIILAVVFVLSVAVVLATTLGMLNATKTATGTIKFDLADYDLQVDLGSASDEKIYPKHTANTNEVKLKNTYKGTGATAGMGGVYVKLVFTEVQIGNDKYAVKSISENTTDKTIEIVATIGSGDSASLMTIALKQSAGKSGAENSTTTELFWRANTSEKAVYLSSVGIGTTLSDNNKAKLAFTDKNATEKTVSINMQITGKASSANNGFNATGSGDGLLNKYQGYTVAVKYIAYWGTTIANIGKTSAKNSFDLS